MNCLSFSGPGVVDFLAVYCDGGATNADVWIQIIIDGTTVLTDFLVCETGGADEGAVAIGGMPILSDTPNSYPHSIAFEPIAFTSSFVVQIKATPATGDDFKTVHRVKYHA